MPSQGAAVRQLSHTARLRAKDDDQPERVTERKARESGLLAVRLSRVLAFIDAHLDKNITLADLAHEAHLSVFYFATQFKRSTGLSPQQYILHRRVNRARELLRTTSLSVLDVSLDLGFRHQNNFTRAFRRITGTTPTRFRQGAGL
ncbi:MAG TPA: AraC family transcriptional regulator [Candidatus Acidoferrales bacterium]|nr:AraC family transcriptional regulator [Candidatus Acidoferrales bacterium]